MKKVNAANLQLMHSAMTHFVGEPIAKMDRFDDTIMFQTSEGVTGIVEPNYVGNMDIWIGEEVVYEIEKDLFDLLESDKRGIGLIEFYNNLKEVDEDMFKEESRLFFYMVKTSTENIILNYDLPLVGDTRIGETQIHYTEDQKMKINLN
jgi:hypothetical protein